MSEKAVRKSMAGKMARALGVSVQAAELILAEAPKIEKEAARRAFAQPAVVVGPPPDLQMAEINRRLRENSLRRFLMKQQPAPEPEPEPVILKIAPKRVIARRGPGRTGSG